MNQLPEGFEGFEDVSPKPRNDSPRERAIEFVSSLHVGDSVKVGSTKWKIYKEHGILKHLTKSGTKGEKFYRLDISSFEPLTAIVIQMLGGGAYDGKVVAQGPLTKI